MCALAFVKMSKSLAGLNGLIYSEGLMTPSSAQLLLIKTQLYPLGFDHKYREVSVHMLPHEKDPSASEKHTVKVTRRVHNSTSFKTLNESRGWCFDENLTWFITLNMCYVKWNGLLHNNWKKCLCVEVQSLNFSWHKTIWTSLPTITNCPQTEEVRELQLMVESSGSTANINLNLESSPLMDVIMTC